MPRSRFDPLSGRFRVRYAANLPAAAARERFPSRILTERDGDLWPVHLNLSGPALALSGQANLVALGLDDRVSTGGSTPPGDSTPIPCSRPAADSPMPPTGGESHLRRFSAGRERCQREAAASRSLLVQSGGLSTRGRFAVRRRSTWTSRFGLGYSFPQKWLV
jgi:hypothetical protein